MKTLKVILISTLLIVLTLSVSGQKSKWLWENKSSTILPTLTEINYVDGVTQPVQGQLNSKANASMVDTAFYKVSDAVLGYTKTQVDSLKVEQFKKYNILKELGSTCKTTTKWCDIKDRFAVGLTDGVTLLVELDKVPYSYTLTSVKYYPVATGSYTFDQNNKIGVYKKVGTTFTLVASTVDNTALWTQTSGTTASATFAIPYAVPANEQLYLGLLLNYSAVVTAATINGSSLSGSTYFENTLWGTTYPILLQKTGTADLATPFDISTCIRASGIPMFVAY